MSHISIPAIGSIVARSARSVVGFVRLRFNRHTPSSASDSRVEPVVVARTPLALTAGANNVVPSAQQTLTVHPRRRSQRDARPFTELDAGIEDAYRAAQQHEPSREERDFLASAILVNDLSEANAIGAETCAGSGFHPVPPPPMPKDFGDASERSADRPFGLKFTSPSDAEATVKSMLWHHDAYSLMRGLKSSYAPNLSQAIQDLAVRISPPFEWRNPDLYGPIRAPQVAVGPRHSRDSPSVLAMGLANGPTLYELVTTQRPKALLPEAAQKLSLSMMLETAMLTATQQALFARYSDLVLPSVEAIHDEYLDKAKGSVSNIAGWSGLKFDDETRWFVSQSLTKKLVASIDIRISPSRSANVGVRTGPSPRNFIFDAGDADVSWQSQLVELVSRDANSSSGPRFRRFPDCLRRVDVPTSLVHGQHFEDFAHLTDFHWARLDSNQKVLIRFAGDLVREMLLIAFGAPDDYDSIDVAEQMAIDLNHVLNHDCDSWSQRIWERYESWAELNARNYEIGGFLRKLRQVELNIVYLRKIGWSIGTAEYDKMSDQKFRALFDLEKVVEQETVEYLKTCADEIHELGFKCGLSIEEHDAWSSFLTAAAKSLSLDYGIDWRDDVRLTHAAA